MWSDIDQILKRSITTSKTTSWKTYKSYTNKNRQIKRPRTIWTSPNNLFGVNLFYWRKITRSSIKSQLLSNDGNDAHRYPVSMSLLIWRMTFFHLLSITKWIREKTFLYELYHNNNKWNEQNNDQFTRCPFLQRLFLEFSLTVYAHVYNDAGHHIES